MLTKQVNDIKNTVVSVAFLHFPFLDIKKRCSVSWSQLVSVACGCFFSEPQASAAPHGIDEPATPELPLT